MTTEANTQIGLVVAAHGRRGRLETATQVIPYIVKGRKLRVVCGDLAEWQPGENANAAIVTAIRERENELLRLRPDGTNTIETIAANLTHVLVVVAPYPEPDWYLVDRYICAGELMGCAVAIVAHKSDLGNDLAAVLEVYRGLGYRCLASSVRSGAGLPAVADSIAGGTAILVGQSGVGKSSLINALCPKAEATVGEVSTATAEGRHTTTASTMHRLANGSRLVDTPGVRDFIPGFTSAERVAAGFVEIAALAADCRFANCLHSREPNCAVKAAVENSRINERRYASYKRLINSL